MFYACGESLMTFKTLLACTDGSPASEGALQAALVLARRSSAEVHLLQVLEFNPGFASQALDYLKEWEKEAWEGLKRWLDQAQAAGLGAQAMVRLGEAACSAILREAGDCGADLIVMGRHGRTGLSRLLMGSVTARVIGLSPVPVLVVPRKAPLAFSRLLVALDGSPYSDAAWRAAQSLARTWNGKLLAASVAREEREIPELENLLGRCETEATTAGLSLRTFLLQGIPDEALVQEAQKQEVDLLILGSHGRTGFRRLLMGSVTERVIGRSSCPVLVIKLREGNP